MKKILKCLTACMLALSLGCSANTSTKSSTSQSSKINVTSSKTKVSYTFTLKENYKQVRVSYARLNQNLWTIYKSVIKKDLKGKKFSLTLSKKANIPYVYTFNDTQENGTSFTTFPYQYEQKYITCRSTSFNPEKKTPIFGVLDDANKNNKLSFNAIDNDTKFDGKDQAVIIYIRFIK